MGDREEEPYLGEHTAPAAEEPYLGERSGHGGGFDPNPVESGRRAEQSLGWAWRLPYFDERHPQYGAALPEEALSAPLPLSDMGERPDLPAEVVEAMHAAFAEARENFEEHGDPFVAGDQRLAAALGSTGVQGQQESESGDSGPEETTDTVHRPDADATEPQS